MAEFQETTRLKLRDLSSPDRSVRRAAAYYLGEAGADTAIARLVRLYTTDPDRGVRRAAAYALGMFKAVDVALKRGEEERVVALLRGIEDGGKLGQRRTVSRGAVAALALGLVLLLAGLMAAHVLLPGLRPLPGGLDPAALLRGAPSAATAREDMRGVYTRVSDDTMRLQEQFQSVLGGGSVDCKAFFNDAPAYVLPAGIAADSNLGGAARLLTDAQAAIAPARERYADACAGGTPLAPSEVGAFLAPLLAVQRSFPMIDAALDAPADPTAAPAEPTTAPAEPTAAPAEPTAAPATAAPAAAGPDARPHLIQLYGILSQVLDPRGPSSLLARYWQDVQQGGTTRGCADPAPSIPADYVVDAATLAALPTLAQAVEQVNLGLGVLRDGWRVFDSACASRQWAASVDQGIQYAATADQAFRNANALLDAVRGGA